MEYKYKTYNDIYEEEEFKQKKAHFETTDNIFDMYEMYRYFFDRIPECEEYHKRLEESFEQFVDFKNVEIGNPFLLSLDTAKVQPFKDNPYVDERKAFTPIQINTPNKPIKLAFVGDTESEEE
jgi:hypothetical protein